MNSQKLTSEHLSRTAVVYIRQSSRIQVLENIESQRRQYDLAKKASSMGFADVEVIDSDLGRSGSGLVKRPGFEALVVKLSTGTVGAVFCLEASRVARNGRDWQLVVDLCGWMGSVLVDGEAIYDPRLPADRLMLGMKGSLSEYELALLRRRGHEALMSKARRGELRFMVPVGYQWHRRCQIELSPDRRIQEMVHLVFRLFTELGSSRQVLLRLLDDKIELPAQVFSKQGTEFKWKLPVYNTVHRIIKNPFYAGAYAYGRTQSRTEVREGGARKTAGHKRERDDWLVLIKDHHPAYISWETYECNQTQIAENTHMNKRMARGSARGGRALLAGLFRCKRCGRMLHVTYSGARGDVPRYHCRGAMVNHGRGSCLSFGGLRVDQAIERELFAVLQGPAIEAALQAAQEQKQQADAKVRVLELELEQAAYECRLAERRYAAVDPDKRLVASELEARWEAALRNQSKVKQLLEEASKERPLRKVVEPEKLLSLAHDLEQVWKSPEASMRLKQRIVRLLIREIMVDVDKDAAMIHAIIHWEGGRHQRLDIRKNRTGHHRRSTSLEAVEVIRRMAGQWPDEQIAATLNRLGMKTGTGNTWTAQSVGSVRRYRDLPKYDPTLVDTDILTLQRAAESLGVSTSAVRRLIERKILTATQVVPNAPWQIEAGALEDPGVVEAIKAIKGRRGRPRTQNSDDQTLVFPGM